MGMRRIVLLLASMALAVVFGSGVVLAALLAIMVASPAFAQEESLPDLVVDKTGPEVVSIAKSETANVQHDITVTNIGDAPAIFPATVPAPVLLRDVIYAHGQRQGGGAANMNNCPTSRPRPQVPEEVKERIDVHPAAASEECLEYTTRVPLMPDQSQPHVLYSYYTFDGGGLVTDCATADPDNLIVESDETNNTDCLTTHVTRSPR